MTTLAGPASNLAMALIALILLVVLKHAAAVGLDALHVAMAIGSGHGKEVDTTSLPALFPVALLLYYGILTNVLLFIFNLIPIPPLDGSRIFRYLLPSRVEQIYDQIGGYGMILVFFFAGRFIFPIFYWPVLDAFDFVLNHV